MKHTRSFATPTADTQPSSTTTPRRDGPPPVVALIGCRANPRLPFGGVRILTVRDGVVRVFQRGGDLDHEFPTAGLTVRPTRMGNLLLTWADGSISVNPIFEATPVTKAARATLVREIEACGPDDEIVAIMPASAEGLGTVTLKPLKALADVRGALVDAIEAHGTAAR